MSPTPGLPTGGGGPLAALARRVARGHGPQAAVLRAGVVACLAFGLVGWSRLLMPSLIRSIEAEFGQTDVGMGLYYLLGALLYAVGSFVGGALTMRLGRRASLVIAALALAGSLAGQGLAHDWSWFLLASVPGSLGAGALDVGVNALFLDLFWQAPGGALNLLHLSFSVAALAAPVGAAVVVGAGIGWPGLLVASGAAWLLVAALLAAATPQGHGRRPPEVGTGRTRASRRLVLPLAAFAVAIACYVAAEAGVSDWLVRFLDALPLGEAASALTLFWGGIALGRLVCARVANRLDPGRAAAAFALAGAVLLAGAALTPSQAASLVLFGLVGFAFGPVYPLVMAAAGTLLPGRAALVTTTLTAAAVVGAIAYPPVVGLLSVTVGLRVAMLGAAGLAVACVVALVSGRRAARLAVGRASAEEPATGA